MDPRPRRTALNASAVRASLEPIANKLREAGARLFSFIQDKKSIIVGRACAPPTGKGKRSAGGVPIRNGRSSASRLQFLSTGKSTLSSLLFSRRPRPALSKTRPTRESAVLHTRMLIEEEEEEESWEGLVDLEPDFVVFFFNKNNVDLIVCHEMFEEWQENLYLKIWIIRVRNFFRGLISETRSNSIEKSHSSPTFIDTSLSCFEQLTFTLA